jgi:hypothetical protein
MIFLGLYLSYWPKRNATQAYRGAYNPNASEAVAAAAGSRLLAKGRIRDYLAGARLDAFHLARRTYIAAIGGAVIPILATDPRTGRTVKIGERPDHRVRIMAAEALARLHGLNQSPAR